MLIWLTIQITQTLFRETLTSDSRNALACVAGFEILAELILVGVLILSVIYAMTHKK